MIKSQLYVLLLVFIFAFSLGSCRDQTKNSSKSSNKALDTATNEKSGSGIGRFTTVTLNSIDEAQAKKGKEIFLSRCAVCHSPGAERLIGPGLKEVTKRRDPVWILNMITNSEEMVEKDPVAMKLYQEYSLLMPNQSLSDEEVLQVLEYLRQNDIQ